MSYLIAALLAQDGLTNGAIYALVALALVMVFSVTRIIFIPQGELVTYASLSLASLQQGRVPGSLWLILMLGVLAAGLEAFAYLRRDRSPARLRAMAAYLLVPAAVSALTYATADAGFGFIWNIVLVLLIVVPMGPLIYRVAFRPLGDATVLLSLIVAMAVHFVLLGCGLLFFGPEGVRTPPLLPGRYPIFGVPVSGQALVVIAVAVVAIVALALYFGRTLSGKALRATAFNRVGARLVGIPTEQAARLVFLLAGLAGALCGVLVAPITTIYYDTGFLIGLKGFIAAIFAGLASYPLAALGAVILGLFESYSSFFASLYKDSIVFALIIPILLWRSLRSTQIQEDEE
ncbi:branched-chain amino acid ABC transporter permease [Aurantimonas sp. VKM B-3413]|uniref:branched-chain amino acid ABC transporter permease n=1 Tax=Aurantimonas sp. VKM B-3413 TaxID=2779401 RepID=UPI001E651CA3|nr:branched-chain amino acid ABC transporter permease [Aurantimonas sp. VKM B-3413]MCB8836282.1 branched-chain amino acid ABC transporter permease [Aurantimonas sp. VKM B-3413]